LTRAGALVADPDEEGASPYLNLERPDDDALAVLESASVRYRIAVGPIAGRKTLRLQAPGAVGTATQATKRLTATRDGFSLNASVACGAGERKKLERLQPHYIIVRTHTVAFHGDGYTRRAPLARRERGRGACLRRQRGVYRT